MNEVLNTPVTFDPARCNHLGKAAIDCPHCLRHRVVELERIAAWLIRGVQHVIESLDENVEKYDEEHEGWEAQLRSHCLGTLTADDGTPLPTKFVAALAAHDAEHDAL